MARFRSINLTSKIIGAMMASAALTGLTQAWLGNENVRESFYSNLERQLASVAEITASGVGVYFENVRGVVRSLGGDPRIINALSAFDNRRDTLGSGLMTRETERTLQDYYEKNYVSALVRGSSGSPIAAAFVPGTEADRYLQYHYIVANPATEDEKERLDRADDDDSPYTQAHQRLHPGLRALKRNHELADLFLINADGVVVYSVIKEIDFMTDLLDGPFDDSGLARAFAAARGERAARPIVVADYTFYQPSKGAPSFFIATPVYSGSDFLGVVAVQLLADELDAIVSHDGDWSAAGLGDTGDVFVVANDGLLRTSTRGFEEGRERFLAGLRSVGVASTTTSRMEAFGTPINLASAASRLPENGIVESGAARVVSGFGGEEVLAVIAPVRIEGLDWTVVAEMPLAEANAPVSAFQRVMMIALATTVALTTIGAMILAGSFTRPLRRLAERFDEVAEGDGEEDVALERGDEIGDLSRSAQGMLDTLRSRLADAERERLGSHDLLGRFLPDGIVRRIESRGHDGELELDEIAEAVPNATYVFARLSGYETMMATLAPVEVVGVLDQLVRAVDLAAEKHGIEKVRTVGDSYFAAAGLSAPLIDHRQRALAFARELQDIIERYRRDSGVPVQVSIGLAAGSAAAGVIGRTKLAFDIWGQPVDECMTLATAAAPGEIRVTADLAEALADTARFDATDPATPGLVLAEPDTEGASAAALSPVLDGPRAADVREGVR